ncbi:hypothetical protein Ddye_008270 [Dipteronia dyeriana]|uniref:CCHC-type domain-containing protein n=1 Tax=Dipteronia dyeriana TaxID=168575 RepID=A0AAD9X9K1_9ROSI|nr:hypothetical protein Ddye_008270 [Dipteronia dyeriana]
MFISDQHKEIAKTMEIVYPNAPHGLCGFHMAGRPKKSRMPSSDEYRGKKSKTCSWCKQAGHNRQNCPTPLGFTVSSTSETQPTQTRKQRKCGGCRGLGHNKRTSSHGQTSTTDSLHDEDVIGV